MTMEFERNRIFRTDCFKLMEQLPDQSVSLILTDPPYGIRYQNQFTQCRHPPIVGDGGIDFEHFAKESYRILKENSHAYFFTRFDCYAYHYNCLEQAGFSIKNCLVIEKGSVGGIGDLRGSYANNAEWIIFCQKGRRLFNHTTLLCNRKKEGTIFHPGRKPSQKYKTRFNACWFGSEYPKATHNATWQRKNQVFHPTIKNETFLSWLIQISSQPGELVFDGFMGSGSTAVAAIITGRDYIGAEINDNYYNVAKMRITETEAINHRPIAR